MPTTGVNSVSITSRADVLWARRTCWLIGVTVIRSRRDILRLVAGAAGGVLAAGCGAQTVPLPPTPLPVPAATPTRDVPTPEAEPSVLVTPTREEVREQPLPTVTASVSSKRLVGYLP